MDTELPQVRIADCRMRDPGRRQASGLQVQAHPAWRRENARVYGCAEHTHLGPQSGSEPPAPPKQSPNKRSGRPGAVPDASGPS
jgi:hypothetical protein